MGLQEMMYTGSLINQFSSLINASGTVVASKVTPFLSKFKNLFTKTDDAAGDLSKLLKTKPNKAFFWSGRYKNASGDMVSVMDEAAEIATQNGGHTLETLLKSKKVNLPEWNINDPALIKAWQDASASFANQVSGNVRAVIGSELRKGNIWQNVELPRLMSNANVKTISVINPQTKLEEIIFERLTK